MPTLSFLAITHVRLLVKDYSVSQYFASLPQKHQILEGYSKQVILSGIMCNIHFTDFNF